MPDTSWYYTQGGHRVGPVPLSELQSLVASTRVSGHELAWTAGMGDWARVLDLPILRGSPIKPSSMKLLEAPTPAQTVPANGDNASISASPVEPAATESAQASEAPYVVPRTTLYGPILLPPRPAATFVDHAEPRGEATTWPLDDEQLTLLEIAGELRRQVTLAAALYRVLMVLIAICSVSMLVVSLCLFVLSTSPHNPAPGYLLFAGILAIFGAIFFFASRFTARSNRAAPMTMLVLFAIIAVLNLLGVYGLLRQDPISAVYCAIGALFAIVFAVISYRGYAAIPEFRRQPVWCQELLIRAKL